MAKQIIVLERIPHDSGAVEYKYVLWAVVPAARQAPIAYYANATFVSAFRFAVAAEVTALQTGLVVEHYESIVFPAGTTIAQIETALQAAFTAWQTLITNDVTYSHYGAYFDGTTWTAGGA